MARGDFLWALGIVTAVVGVAVLVMAVLRARRAAARPRLRAVPPPRPAARLVPRALPRPISRAEVLLGSLSSSSSDGASQALAAVESLESVEAEPDEAEI